MTPQKTIHSARVAGKNGRSLISDEAFRKLYAALLQCRMLDKRLQAGTGYEKWTGREACSAGVAACLRSGDSVAPTPHGLLAGYLHSGLIPCACRDVLTSASQLAAATGDALRHKLEGSGNVSVVFAGCDEPERMREIFAAAARQSLPVIYILEGDASLEDASGRIPVIRVDGCDAVAIYRVAHETIVRAREGCGPTILQCAVWPGEGGPRDPLKKLELYLAGKRLFRRDWKRRLEKKHETSLNEAVKTAGLRGF